MQKIEYPNLLQQIISVFTGLASETDLTVLLSHIANAAKNVVGCEGAIVGLLDRTKRNINIEVLDYSGKQLRKSDYPDVPLSLNGKINSENLCVHVAVSGKPTSVDDIYRYTGFDFESHYTVDKLLHYRTKSVLVLPLVNKKEETTGILQLINSSGNDGSVVIFDESQLRLAEGFAALAAVAIENAKLIEENHRLIEILEQTNQRLEKENRRLRTAIDESYDFSEIVGQSTGIKKVFHLIRKVLNTDAAILVQGETGTGKELIAKALHFNSVRKNKPFVTQNCAALPENLLESELFGYKKGAFSGAVIDKKGLIEQSDGGTLFLDEIGDMPLSLQAKLLRVLQEREVRPLGSVTTVKVNLRVVSATHHDLRKLVDEGKFREDLVYRLSVFPIYLPPLRDRKDDLSELISHFIMHFAGRYNKAIQGVSPRAYELLTGYDYPGNIRELRNILERAVLLSDDGSSVTPDVLPDELVERRGKLLQGGFSEEDAKVSRGSLRNMMEEYEAQVIKRMLQENNWNQSKTAEALAVGRRTLIEKIARYDINTKSSARQSEKI